MIVERHGICCADGLSPPEILMWFIAFRNYNVAKEVTPRSSVIARSEATKQSVLAVWEIATGLRPRNDSRILYQLNKSVCKKFPPAYLQTLFIFALSTAPSAAELTIMAYRAKYPSVMVGAGGFHSLGVVISSAI